MQKIRSITYGILGTLVVLAGVIGVLLYVNRSQNNKPVFANNNKPKFVFNSTQLSDWASFGNTYQDSGPIIAFSVTQCTEGSDCSRLVKKCRVQIDKNNQSCQKLEQYTANGCDIHTYYFSDSINPSVVIKNQLKKLSSYGDAPTEVGVKTLTMRTPEGDKAYQLHQYDTNNKDTSYKKGIALGVIPLSDGHIEVHSTCWKASQLDDVLPVLRTIRLEA